MVPFFFQSSLLHSPAPGPVVDKGGPGPLEIEVVVGAAGLGLAVDGHGAAVDGVAPGRVRVARAAQAHGAAGVELGAANEGRELLQVERIFQVSLAPSCFDCNGYSTLR